MGGKVDTMNSLEQKLKWFQQEQDTKGDRDAQLEALFRAQVMGGVKAFVHDYRQFEHYNFSSLIKRTVKLLMRQEVRRRICELESRQTR